MLRPCRRRVGRFDDPHINPSLKPAPFAEPSSMIRVDQRPDETRRTGRGCPWIAECDVDGQHHEAASRSGAPLALARVLVAAGIPDQRVRVYSQGFVGCMRYPSLYRMAGLTIEESASKPVHPASWSPHPGRVGEQDADLRSPPSSKTGVKEGAG
jgi:hypothetical protein